MLIEQQNEKNTAAKAKVRLMSSFSDGKVDVYSIESILSGVPAFTDETECIDM